jgi:hypothetical protein
MSFSTVDASGKKVALGWSATERIWLDAAMTLPRPECEEAYADIAFMSGRSITAVRHKARDIQNQRWMQKCLMGRQPPRTHAKAVVEKLPEPSIFRPWTAEERMVGRRLLNDVP